MAESSPADRANSPTTSPDAVPQSPPTSSIGKSDSELHDLFIRLRRESFDQRWIFERQWLRNIYYVLGRQWIFYNTKRGEWQDKRLAKWIPRPVTNKAKEIVQTIRAMFTSVKIGVNARPNGEDPASVVTASVADDLAPILHEEHAMNTVLNEMDYWLIVTGNSFLYTYWDRDPKYGVLQVQFEICNKCGAVSSSDDILSAGQRCPECGQQDFRPAIDPTTNLPRIETSPLGRGVTQALSPLELAFPTSIPRWEDVPYVIRLRWRDKLYYENHAELKALVPKIRWVKAPADRSLQIFRSLPLQNDLGTAPLTWGAGPQSTEAEGIAEYELWMKPNNDFPEGLVVRFVGDDDPQVLHIESENLPGPLPYHHANGHPLFPFAHAAYEHVGGRILGSGALDPVIQKFDQVNQLDSLIQMIIQRMANPVWLEPKGAEVEKFTGEPGLVVKWNPLVAGGNAKPERIPGEEVNQSLFAIREQYLKDIEEATGTYDILKGARPTGVEAFSALQLLVERGQSRFANAFQARGDAYRSWFASALELEREFGPDTRTKAVLSPTRQYAFETFKNADLSGSVTIIVEDGTNTPKTSLGERAAIEHLNQLGMVNPQDPDQRYAIYQKFGQSRLAPGMDVQVQGALQKQEAFEKWVTNGGPAQTPDPTHPTYPLRWLPWYDPQIHRQEFLKWANSDRVRQLLQMQPSLEGLLTAHLQLIDVAIQEKQMGQLDPTGLPVAPSSGTARPGRAPTPIPGVPGQGAGRALANSNQNSGALAALPGGPAMQGPQAPQ